MPVASHLVLRRTSCVRSCANCSHLQISSECSEHAPPSKLHLHQMHGPCGQSQASWSSWVTSTSQQHASIAVSRSAAFFFLTPPASRSCPAAPLHPCVRRSSGLFRRPGALTEQVWGSCVDMSPTMAAARPSCDVLSGRAPTCIDSLSHSCYLLLPTHTSWH